MLVAPRRNTHRASTEPGGSARVPRGSSAQCPSHHGDGSGRCASPARDTACRFACSGPRTEPPLRDRPAGCRVSACPASVQAGYCSTTHGHSRLSCVRPLWHPHTPPRIPRSRRSRCMRFIRKTAKKAGANMKTGPQDEARAPPIPHPLEGAEAPHPLCRRRRRAPGSDVGTDHRRHAPGAGGGLRPAAVVRAADWPQLRRHGPLHRRRRALDLAPNQEPHRRARALAEAGARADRLLSCREATLGRDGFTCRPICSQRCSSRRVPRSSCATVEGQPGLCRP